MTQTAKAADLSPVVDSGLRSTDPVAAASERSLPYALVHIVAGEATKDLMVPQVVAHMVQHAVTSGPLQPARVVIVFFEPVRVALRRAVRTRVRQIRAAAPQVQIILMPYVSRLAQRRNAAALGRLLRARIGRLPTVFHCRGESAAEWAMELQSHFPHSAIVADIRGAWPEEFLFERGFDDPAEADHETRAHYEAFLSRLRSVLDRAGAVLSVSPDLLDWLRAVGASKEALTYVPCCVPEIRFSADARRRIRAALGLDGKLVLVYLGSVARYQHIEDGVIPFFRAMAMECDTAHLLCLTNDDASMRSALSRAAAPQDRVTILRLPHDRVAEYLCAGDAGLLLRAPSHMNRYSRPTKLAEYLACGLPVILSRGMGRTDELLERSGAGVLMNAFTSSDAELRREARCVLAALSAEGDRMRERALQLCSDHFLWSRYIDRVRAAYQRALQA